MTCELGQGQTVYVFVGMILYQGMLCGGWQGNRN